MTAKTTDLARLQEIHDVIIQTKAQIQAIGFTKQAFLNPQTDAQDLIAEGLMNRVFRVCEEAGKLSDALATQYGFERRAASGVRNRLAHAYGEVNKEIIWDVIENDFDALLDSCQQYADDIGVDFE